MKAFTGQVIPSNDPRYEFHYGSDQMFKDRVYRIWDVTEAVYVKDPMNPLYDIEFQTQQEAEIHVAGLDPAVWKDDRGEDMPPELQLLMELVGIDYKDVTAVTVVHSTPPEVRVRLRPEGGKPDLTIISRTQ